MGRPATAGTRGARQGRASLRAPQDIQEDSKGSRVTTVAPAVMVLQEAIAGIVIFSFLFIQYITINCSRGGGSSAYNPPREASFSNSYGSGNGVNSSSTSTNYGSNFGASTTNYSPYTGSSNSYSSSSNKSSSQQQSSSSYSSSAATTSSGPSSQFAGESGNSTAGSGKTGNSYDSTQTSSSAGTYGGVGQSTSGSNVSSLGLSANSTLSSSSKMSVNTTSGKMVPGMPPGVPGVLPAQYMIGANAAAGEA